MSKDIKKALEHCIDNECVDCPNNEELGSGEIVCRARLLPDVLQYISDLQHRLEVAEKALELACDYLVSKDDKDDKLHKLVENIYSTNKYLETKISYFKEQAEREVKGE